MNNIKKSRFKLFFGLILLNITFSVTAQNCDNEFLQPSLKTLESQNSDCNNVFEFFTDEIKSVDVVLHVIHKENDLSKNFNVANLVQRNMLLEKMATLQNQYSNVTPPTELGDQCITEYRSDTKIRFNLLEIISHQNDSYWSAGNVKHNESLDLQAQMYNEYVANNINMSDYYKNNVLHIFLLGAKLIDEDANGELDGNFTTVSYIVGGKGIAHNKYIVMRGLHYKALNDYYSFLNGSTLGHEIGHTFGLSHTFETSGYVCCDVKTQESTSNNMMDYSNPTIPNKTAFTECQITVMNYYISKNYKGELSLDNPIHCYNNNYNIVSCESNLENDILINQQSVLWDNNRHIKSVVRIKKGSTLTITSTLFMSNNTQIIIEKGGQLIISNGRVKGACSLGWKGIKVEGGKKDFDLKMSNSVIQDVVSPEAITTIAVDRKFNNGIIQLDNVTFHNNKSAVKIVGNNAVSNSSYFKECKFRDESISLWYVNDVLIEDNKFICEEDYSLLSVNSSFKFSNNSMFANTDKMSPELLILRTEVGQSSQIINNTFRIHGYGNRNIIYSSGATFNENSVINNTFRKYSYSDGDISNSIQLIGSNYFKISYNEFLGVSNPIKLHNNGDDFNNRINNNKIDYSNIGIESNGKHANLNFYNNCFYKKSSSLADVYVAGVISPTISGLNSNDSANNCFSEPLRMENGFQHIRALLSSLLSSVTYVGATLDEADCTYPQTNISNMNITDTATSVSLPLCGIDDFITVNGYAENDTDFIKNNKQQDQNKRVLFRDLLLKKQFKKARDVFKNSKSKEGKTLVYSTYFYEEDFVSAKYYLNNIIEKTIGMEDYAIVQKINLDKILQGDKFNLLDKDVSKIIEIANSNSDYSAYANSLYFILTGNLIEYKSNVEFNDNNLEKSKKNVSVIVYPNPVNEFININISETEKVKLEVFDLIGRLVFCKEKINDNKIKINSSSWNTGIYILRITKNNELIKNVKLILK